MKKKICDPDLSNTNVFHCGILCIIFRSMKPGDIILDIQLTENKNQSPNFADAA
ncbi:predicted protein [Plenodomus lingam JN3]|uniref:Uncharacterized protein n=1 Tax=Leptosphaeria maculans (strain JN3 / isolate v23.1.3 / race Av1-4-5-6-7-8) TaxID=985895 RepID=E5A6N7_LEPMJ|nr:predicted protein [Plenodomus lingam JN3]CBX99282.1 predicted protein [Plenodomus lingam JN3]